MYMSPGPLPPGPGLAPASVGPVTATAFTKISLNIWENILVNIVNYGYGKTRVQEKCACDKMCKCVLQNQDQQDFNLNDVLRTIVAQVSCFVEILSYEFKQSSCRNINRFVDK